jgi:hypothetical protein
LNVNIKIVNIIDTWQWKRIKVTGKRVMDKVEGDNGE